MKRMLAIEMVLMVLFCASALAEPGSTSLTVAGAGVVSIMADQASVVVGVEEISDNVLEAQSSVNSKINAISEALLQAGVEPKNLSTEQIYIDTNYDTTFTVRRMTGYTVSNRISITTSEIDKLGEYIDLAFKAGANTLGSVSFSAKETEPAQEEALRLAVENAREKAEVIADASGLEIVRIVSIDESSEVYGYNGTAKYSNLRLSESSDAATMVQAASLEVRATVKIEFELAEGK